MQPRRVGDVYRITIQPKCAKTRRSKGQAALGLATAWKANMSATWPFMGGQHECEIQRHQSHITGVTQNSTTLTVVILLRQSLAWTCIRGCGHSLCLTGHHQSRKTRSSSAMRMHGLDRTYWRVGGQGDVVVQAQQHKLGFGSPQREHGVVPK